MPSPPASSATPFPCHGDSVVRAAFVLALFGWGVGFYGPAVFLHAVLVRTGWPLPLGSAAVSLHFLFGAGVVACLPRLHRRFGVPAATVGGAIVLAMGVLGWATATEPWQLFAAALLTGGGWAPLGAAGIHAIVAPWFGRTRPMALAKAYNGASVGGLVFSPLWAVLIERIGFAAAAMVVGLAMVSVVLSIASLELARTPDGEGLASATAPAASTAAAGPALWKDRRFLTLAAAMSLGLFAQIGLLAQLFSLMAPRMGAQMAGAAMALAAGCGMGGRLLTARLLGLQADRRRAAAISYAVQAAGTLALWSAGLEPGTLLVLGLVLFGLGIGNATSLPPLIAQAEFAPADVPRVVARSVALAQALYAFAPVALAGLLEAATGAYFGVVCALQVLAAACMLGACSISRRRQAAWPTGAPPPRPLPSGSGAIPDAPRTRRRV